MWNDQPPRKFNPIIQLDTIITGKKIAGAVDTLRKEMQEKHSDLLVVTALDEVACELLQNIIQTIFYFISVAQWI